MSTNTLTEKLDPNYLMNPDVDPVVEYQKWKEQGHHDGYTVKDFEKHIQILRNAAKANLEEELCEGKQGKALKKAIREYDGPLGDFNTAKATILAQVTGSCFF